jgi:hypothetical protein
VFLFVLVVVLHQDNHYYSNNVVGWPTEMKFVDGCWNVSYHRNGQEILWCKSISPEAVLPGKWDWVMYDSYGETTVTVAWTTMLIKV